ncbi:hypothetical protein B0H14DRAFT_2595965 [Mycena olivaceomarginata]|nr:hypothetical protein B0H14DRAFT_2595965 [Mycena olivaceomarginata]
MLSGNDAQTDALQNPAPIGPHIHPAVILVRIGATQRRWHAPNAAFPPPSHVDIPVPVDVHPPVTRACVRMPLGLVYNALGTACDAALPVAHDDEPFTACATGVPFAPGESPSAELSARSLGLMEEMPLDVLACRGRRELI